MASAAKVACKTLLMYTCYQFSTEIRVQVFPQGSILFSIQYLIHTSDMPQILKHTNQHMQTIPHLLVSTRIRM